MQQTTSTIAPPPRRTILRRPAVEALTGQGQSSLYASMLAGLFPRPVKLVGSRSVGWPSDEVSAVNEARIAGITPDDMRALVARLEAARKASH